jgi:signal transduction histidine kinase
MRARKVTIMVALSMFPVALAGADVFLAMRIYDAVSGTYSTAQLPLFGIATTLSYALVSLIGALVIAHQPRHRIGWLLWLIGVFWQLWEFANVYQIYNQYLRTPGPPRPTLPGTWTAWAMNPVLWLPGAALSITLLPLLFPTGRALSARWRWAGWLALAGIGIAFIPTSHHNWTRRYYYPTAHKILDVTRPEWVDWAFRVGLILIIVAGVTSIASLGVRLRCSHGVERQQLKWFLFGAASASIAAGIFMGTNEQLYYTTSIDPTWIPAMSQLALATGLLCLSVTIAIAIVRHHLFDIDIIINRTLVYGALSLCVVVIYLLVVGVLGAALDDRSSLFNSLAATGVIAVVFQPLRARLQRGVNRLFYGERDQPYRVLARLGQRLEATLAPDAILGTIVETIAQALKLPYVALALQGDGGLTIAAAHGTPAPASPPLRLPLVYQHATIGELLVAPRARGESFSPADRQLLADLARQVGVAAHAVRLTADLQRSREQLVTAREEERRRLRRDLHDGLGPALASLTLQAEAVHELLATNPTEADALQREVIAQLQAATTEIRRVVYALRPPALDDLGLAGALRSTAARYEHGALRITIETPDALPPLPAAVEVAAYRIATEALTNVARHAAARTCTLRLTVAAALTLEIIDDGIGLPEGYQAGVGLSSMRERAAELGGSLLVERRSIGGTRVLAQLPLPTIRAEPERNQEGA